jgi:hypothetical protein
VEELKQLELVDICAQDLCNAFKLGPRWMPLARLPSRRFAKVLIAFDDRLGRDGIAAAGQYLVEHFTGGVKVTGQEHLPRTGPLIVASNHPGMADAMALWAAIGRADLKVIAAERDLLKLLPNVSRSLIISQPESTQAIRLSLEHLRSGGALLTFPAGKIEPDPSIRQGGYESIETWSASPAALATKVEGTVLVPALVAGVISGPATNSLLVRRFKNQKDRDWAGATLQILLPWYRHVKVSVDFGRAVSGSSCDLKSTMKHLLETYASRKAVR